MQSSHSVQPNPPVKLAEWAYLLTLRRRWRQEAKIVAWTNGCFDLLHAGHVRSCAHRAGPAATFWSWG